MSKSIQLNFKFIPIFDGTVQLIGYVNLNGEDVQVFNEKFESQEYAEQYALAVSREMKAGKVKYTMKH